MAQTLFQIFPNPEDLLSLPPEVLASILVENIPDHRRREGHFLLGDFTYGCLQQYGGQNAYPHKYDAPVTNAIAEALNWLTAQGLIMPDPGQPSQWLMLTRRGQSLKTRADVEAFRKAHILPRELLNPVFSERVWPLFLQGDYDTAVFRAFQEIEVKVRETCHYSDKLLGVDLMRKAFHEETGPLRNRAAVTAERQAERDLFVGSIGHAKNPSSHRNIDHDPSAAAQLIVFASYLLDIVERRSAEMAAAAA